MKNTYIELPTEVRQRIENEVRELAIREEINANGNGIELSGRFWLDRFVNQVKTERSKAWFREQELLSQIEGLKKQIR
jgi:hypothetical protein